MSASSRAITVAKGDGIGPEIMDASLLVIREAGAPLEIEFVDVGEQVFRRGVLAGIEPATWDSIRRTRVFYKAPVSTPHGGGFKSINVTTRKTLDLFANVRPARAYGPFIETRHPKMDVVVIRENEEDVYAGIEHRQTDEVVQCLKLISRPGSERLIRYAFEYARANGRKQVACFTKDNIMKMTDGLFRRIFDEVGSEYPDIERRHLVVDIGTAQIADVPERFDVVVVPNLYGDIVSDVTAQLTGSVGLGASANIGQHASMFEAVHGSAPDIAGRDLANPSGLLLSGVMMLAHLGLNEVAERVHNAWLRTIEDGLHTADVFRPGVSVDIVGTQEFARAIVSRLGQMPRRLAPVRYAESRSIELPTLRSYTPARRELRGVDVFVCWTGSSRNPDELGKIALETAGDGLFARMITNRGQKVWPDGAPETFCTDHWRCRFEAGENAVVSPTALIRLQQRMVDAGLDVIKTENLYLVDGEPGYSRAQGA